jgi:hypothetical protein
MRKGILLTIVSVIVIYVMPIFSTYAQQKSDIIIVRNDMIVLSEKQKSAYNVFIDRLKEYPSFDTSSNKNSLPSWIYTNSNDENLNRLREKYDLEKVAGKGNEIERLINLMEWVHKMLHRNEAEYGVPKEKDAFSIIEFVQEKGNYINCKMKSLVLNEVLLSLGYSSRRIIFKPIAPEGDVHSIVSVYSTTLRKWICLDPTFNTYFVDESGEILGFLDIREIYKTGIAPNFKSIIIPMDDPLRLWGIPFDSYNNWYAVYMAKNSFQVLCPVKSEFAYESSEDAKYVLLSPKEFNINVGDNKPNWVFVKDMNYFFEKPF